MRAAINKQYVCKIIVPNHEDTDKEQQDNNLCSCVRSKQRKQYEKNELEAKILNNQLASVLQNVQIEDWRYRTGGSKVTFIDTNFPTPENPGYHNIDKKKLGQLRESYVNNENLTKLRIPRDAVQELKTRDVAKVIAKAIITNPTLTANLHKKMKELVSGKTEVTIVPTKTIIASDSTFSNQMNKMFPNFIINRKNQVITIDQKNKTTIDWKQLEKSNKDEEAETGIRQARKQVLSIKEFNYNILPQMVNQTKIEKDTIRSRIAEDEDTIIIPERKGSYIELKIYIPVYWPSPSRVYTTAALPQEYRKSTNTYIIKDIPKEISLLPGDIKNMKPDSARNPCA